MKPALITATDLPSFDVSITPDGQLLRERALQSLEKIDIITCDEERDAALQTVATAKGFVRDIGDAHSILKRPILDAGTALDTAKRNAVSGVEAEYKRVERLCGDYALEQRRKAERAEQERLAEIRRAEEAERVAAEAQRRAEEAERLRQQAELAAQEARSKKAKQEAEAAALRAKQEQEAALKLQQDAQAKADEAAAAADFEHEAPQITKSAARETETYDFEVEDVAALYEACPRAVELKAKRSIIADMIKAGTRELAGVRIWPVVKVAAKAQSSTALLR